MTSPPAARTSAACVNGSVLTPASDSCPASTLELVLTNSEPSSSGIGHVGSVTL